MTFSSKAVRKKNLGVLQAAGFDVAPSLPLPDESPRLRPTDEIAGRLAALNAWFVFVTSPPERFPTRLLLDHIREHELEGHLTSEERSHIGMDRGIVRTQLADSAGWRTENVLPLAWILGGAREPSIDGEMLDANTIRSLVLSPPIGGQGEYTAWRRGLRARPVEEVAAMEDLFYCCHNAVRSAQVEQMNAKRPSAKAPRTVPLDFDPIGNGGVIHERRHALTWALAPGVAWEDTDLST